eukprot:1184298-Rhodomonas_salina.1
MGQREHWERAGLTWAGPEHAMALPCELRAALGLAGGAYARSVPGAAEGACSRIAVSLAH